MKNLRRNFLDVNNDVAEVRINIKAPPVLSTGQNTMNKYIPLGSAAPLLKSLLDCKYAPMTDIK